MASAQRFSLVGHDHGFSVLDMMMGQEIWFDPGKASIVDREGKPVSAASPDFVEIVEALLNADETKTLEKYFEQKRRETPGDGTTILENQTGSTLRLQNGNQSPVVEFRRTLDGSIQRREFQTQEEGYLGPDHRWQTLSRSEVIHYLNYGGVVGIWLDDLRERGLIQTRRQNRAAAASAS